MKRAYPSPFYTEIERLYAEASTKDDVPIFLEIGKQALATLNLSQVGSNKDLSTTVSGYFRRGRGKEVVTRVHQALENECETSGTPSIDAKHYWLKTEGASIFLTNPNYVGPPQAQTRELTDAIRDIIHETPLRPYEPVEVTPERDESIAAIVSDMHVGLDPNPNRRAMYPVVYNGDVFRQNLGKVFSALKRKTEAEGPVTLLSVSDLGDGLDGFNRLTTRGGHTLEQNMDNVDMFQTFVQEKLRLAENLIHSGMAKRYVFNNVSNDNHGGDFAAIANLTIQMILERSYPKEVVQFRVMKRFMEHFTYGDHAFILCHGKDQEYQFKGLPLLLDMKTEKFVRRYIDHHGIKSKYIHVWKGDLHQNSYSKCESFDYRNFMSFAPPSQWVANNFPGSYSGFAIQRIPKWNNEIQHTDYMLEFEPVRGEVVEEYAY